MRALLHQRLGPVHRPDSAAYAGHSSGGQHPHQAIVRALSHRGIQIDHLDLRKRRELAEHLLGRVALQSFLAALDQLHHLAAHQIDARDDHAASLTGMPRLSSSSFN